MPIRGVEAACQPIGFFEIEIHFSFPVGQRIGAEGFKCLVRMARGGRTHGALDFVKQLVVKRNVQCYVVELRRKLHLKSTRVPAGGIPRQKPRGSGLGKPTSRNPLVALLNPKTKIL